MFCTMLTDLSLLSHTFLSVSLSFCASSGNSTKKIMANGERFLTMISAVMQDTWDSPEDFSDARMRALSVYLRDPNFHPDVLMPISQPAARLCAWILGIAQVIGLAKGTSHARLDPFARKPPLALDDAVTMSAPTEDASLASMMMPTLHESAKVASATDKFGKSLTFAEKLEKERKRRGKGNKQSRVPPSSPMATPKVRSSEEKGESRLTTAERRTRRKNRALDRPTSQGYLPESLPPSRQRSLSPTYVSFGRGESRPESPVREKAMTSPWGGSSSGARYSRSAGIGNASIDRDYLTEGSRPASVTVGSHKRIRKKKKKVCHLACEGEGRKDV